MDMATALPQVIKTCKLARGLNEAARALDQRRAQLCLLASNCTEQNYIVLIEALCKEHQIPLIKVDDNKILGQWVGLCKIDEDGNPKKIVKCSCAVITQWGPESPALAVVKSHLSSTQ